MYEVFTNGKNEIDTEIISVKVYKSLPIKRRLDMYHANQSRLESLMRIDCSPEYYKKESENIKKDCDNIEASLNFLRSKNAKILRSR